VSDKKVGRGKEDEDDLNNINLLSLPPTTDPEELVEMFRRKEDKLNVIFSTYQYNMRRGSQNRININNIILILGIDSIVEHD